MVFSSYLFLFYFLPIALLVYYLLPNRGKHLGLTLMSYVFYGWANPMFMLLMFISPALDYLAGLVQAHNGFRGWGKPVELLDPSIPRTRTQKTAMIVSICLNLALLGFFKYFNFGMDNYNMVAHALGLPNVDGFMRIILPLGLSFYTFHAMSYSIDVYRGDAKAMSNFIDFACYVSMFSQLVAGPIIRFSEIADQLEHRTYSVQKFARGAAFVALGMGEKIIIANPCGKIADTVFNAGSSGVLDAWYGVTGYAFQIYFDFCGYSNMAIGLGLMLGFVFAKNFDMPYKSQSITEFWRRWHISLSTWLRDYLYLPLGGNRKGKVRTYINLAVVMLLGGLWHGAAWNFIVWGGIHGAWLAFERAQGKTSFYSRLPQVARVAMTFLIVLIAWVFFRASDLHSAVAYLGNMVGLGHVQQGATLISGIIYQPYYLLSFVAAGVIVWGFGDVWGWTQKLSAPKIVACACVLWLSIALLVTQAYNPFIYFIF
ncbi:MAG: MBOAT family O-acyltransferase [bacterium]